MNPGKMLTIARKENRCIIEVNGTEAKVISIARQKCNAKGVRRGRHAREDLIGDCLYKVKALFAELKQQIKLRRVRLRRLWNVAEQFHLAATAQNLKRLVRHLTQKQSPDFSTA